MMPALKFVPEMSTNLSRAQGQGRPGGHHRPGDAARGGDGRCGGGDDKKAIIERGEDFAKYSAAGVQKRFEELTGAELERGASSSETLDTLSLPYSGSSSDSVVRDRYSGFIVLVTGNEFALKAVTKKPPTVAARSSTTGDRGHRVIDW